jgi:hypothetical protein
MGTECTISEVHRIPMTLGAQSTVYSQRWRVPDRLLTHSSCTYRSVRLLCRCLTPLAPLFGHRGFASSSRAPRPHPPESSFVRA